MLRDLLNQKHISWGFLRHVQVKKPVWLYHLSGWMQTAAVEFTIRERDNQRVCHGHVSVQVTFYFYWKVYICRSNEETSKPSSSRNKSDFMNSLPMFRSKVITSKELVWAFGFFGLSDWSQNKLSSEMRFGWWRTQRPLSHLFRWDRGS